LVTCLQQGVENVSCLIVSLGKLLVINDVPRRWLVAGLIRCDGLDDPVPFFI